MKVLQTIIITLLCALVISCSKGSKHIKQSTAENIFSYGIFTNNQFRIDSMGISINVPTNWDMYNLLLIKELEQTGSHWGAHDASKLPHFSKIDFDGVIPLIGIYKYPSNNTTRVVSHLVMTAVSKSWLENNTLDKTNAMLNYTSEHFPYSLLEQGDPYIFENTSGIHAVVESDENGEKVYRDIFTVESKYYIHDIIIATADEEDRKVLLNSVRTFRIE